MIGVEEVVRSPRLGPDTVYGHAPEVCCRRFGSTVMLRVRSGAGLLRLDGPAAALWASLQTPDTLAGSARSLAEAFQAPYEQVRQEVARLVDELVELGALRPQRPAS